MPNRIALTLLTAFSVFAGNCFAQDAEKDAANYLKAFYNVFEGKLDLPADRIVSEKQWLDFLTKKPVPSAPSSLRFDLIQDKRKQSKLLLSELNSIIAVGEGKNDTFLQKEFSKLVPLDAKVSAAPLTDLLKRKISPTNPEVPVAVADAMRWGGLMKVWHIHVNKRFEQGEIEFRTALEELIEDLPEIEKAFDETHGHFGQKTKESDGPTGGSGAGDLSGPVSLHRVMYEFGKSRRNARYERRRGMIRHFQSHD